MINLRFMTNSKRKVFEDSISFSVRAWNYNFGGQWLSFLCGTEHKLTPSEDKMGGGGRLGTRHFQRAV